MRRESTWQFFIMVDNTFISNSERNVMKTDNQFMRALATLFPVPIQVTEGL